MFIVLRHEVRGREVKSVNGGDCDCSNSVQEFGLCTQSMQNELYVLTLLYGLSVSTHLLYVKYDINPLSE
jgi:hypothetical protein